MALRTLIFGIDDQFNELKPFYALEVQRGNLEIVSFAIVENRTIMLLDASGKQRLSAADLNFQLAIISSHKHFYERMKFLESQGIPRSRIIDGRVFKVIGLDFQRLINEGVAYGALNKNPFGDLSHAIYPRIFSDGVTTVRLGIKTYIAGSVLDGSGEISVGNFCSVAANTIFYMEQTLDHNYRSVGTYALDRADWDVPKNFYLPKDVCRINIGSDVWIGRKCTLKSIKPSSPLVIGDGVVIASDSVVVKNVPPYAIVGGNPAKIIKFRFSEDVIESFLRIKWWDWSLDKIHDNFKYFNDVEKFISLHDRS